MTDVGDFIDDFLSHDYDPRKAREYYLRVVKPKLKGRKVGGRYSNLKAPKNPFGGSQVRGPKNPFGNADIDLPDNPFKGIRVGKTKKKSGGTYRGPSSSQEKRERKRIALAKVRDARNKVDNMPDGPKKNRLGRKLDALERKLKKAKSAPGKGVKKAKGAKNSVGSAVTRVKRSADRATRNFGDTVETTRNSKGVVTGRRVTNDRFRKRGTPANRRNVRE